MSKQYGSNLDEYGFERYEENVFPLAYLITLRTYGTWLHGDRRDSIERGRDPRFGAIRIEPNVPLEDKMRKEMRYKPMILSNVQRQIVVGAMRETCEHRQYRLSALNVRTNHGHAVVSATLKPERIVNDLKAYSTRRLRENGFATREDRIWSRGSSTRYLWKPRSVAAAIEYVLYSQGDVPFETVYELNK